MAVAALIAIESTSPLPVDPLVANALPDTEDSETYATELEACADPFADADGDDSDMATTEPAALPLLAEVPIADPVAAESERAAMLELATELELAEPEAEESDTGGTEPLADASPPAETEG